MVVVILLHAVQVCACACTVFIMFHYVFHTELEKTEQVRRWSLARGEEQPCSLLSQLWPAVPSTTGVWGSGQTGQTTGRSLDS